MVKKTKTGYLLNAEEYQQYIMLKNDVKTIKQGIKSLKKLKGTKNNDIYPV